MLGQRIGNFTVLRKIGDGGMGSVYEAVHEGIGRRAAVKVLHPQFSQDENVVTRFFNEARAVNIVQHPGIVGVFDYGQMPDGTAYIVMEFLDGESLKARMRRFGRLGPDSLRLTRQIAGTLAAAHNKGIVHRDLKPDNVIIVPDPEAPGGERAKILDFGIAKIRTTAADEEADSKTQVGAVMGTPKYMSPEQCKGAGQVDDKADVYSLGVMLFEMLGGRLPFEAEGTGALLAMHIYKPPPPLRDFEPGISQQEEALVQSMLSKDPTSRPTMAQVTLMLEQLGAKGTQALSIIHSGSLSAMSLSGLRLPPMGPPSEGVSALGQTFPAGLAGVPGLPSQPVPSTVGDGSRPSIAMAAGQRPDPTSAGTSALSRILLPAVVAVLVAAAALLVIKNKDESAISVTAGPQVGPTQALPTRVSFSVTSNPPGSQVIRDVDGTVLGTTPFRMEQVSARGTLVVSIRHDGFKDEKLSIDLAKDFKQDVTLEALAAAAPVEPPKTPGKIRGSSRRKHDHTRGKEQKKDEEVEVTAVH